MLNQIPRWLVIVLILGIAVNVIFIGFLYFSGGSLGNSLSAVLPQREVFTTGVIKFGSQFSPRRDYCSRASYLTSLDGSPLVDKDTTILLSVDKNSGILDADLFAKTGSVVGVKGIFHQGKSCSVKNSCDCDDSLTVESLTLDKVKTEEYAKTLTSFEGTIACFHAHGVKDEEVDTSACVPVLSTLGAFYELIDLRDAFHLDAEGRHVRVYGTLDPDVSTANVYNLSGYIYVGFAEDIK